MDKKTQNLDPQLKATYERVMGTNLSQPTSSSAPQPTASPPQPTTPVQTAQAVPPTPTSPAQPAPYSPAPQPAVTVPQGSNDAKVVAGNPNATKVVAGASKKSGGLSPILIAVALILFFAIYTSVWLFVFKVNLPFIPKLF